jgi:hypothetical protein
MLRHSLLLQHVDASWVHNIFVGSELLRQDLRHLARLGTLCVRVREYIGAVGAVERDGCRAASVAAASKDSGTKSGMSVARHRGIGVLITDRSTHSGACHVLDQAQAIAVELRRSGGSSVR